MPTTQPDAALRAACVAFAARWSELPPSLAGTYEDALRAAIEAHEAVRVRAVSGDVLEAARFEISVWDCDWRGRPRCDECDVNNGCANMARAILNAVVPLVRAAEMERAAAICDARKAAHVADRSKWHDDESRAACVSDALEAGECAAAIRGGGDGE